jgi:hypothetical protein
MFRPPAIPTVSHLRHKLRTTQKRRPRPVSGPSYSPGGGTMRADLHNGDIEKHLILLLSEVRTTLEVVGRGKPDKARSIKDDDAEHRLAPSDRDGRQIDERNTERRRDTRREPRKPPRYPRYPQPPSLRGSPSRCEFRE